MKDILLKPHFDEQSKISEVELFEGALKRISFKAFDALLACGVRNLESLLRLTSEDMRKVGVSERIRQEIKIFKAN